MIHRSHATNHTQRAWLSIISLSIGILVGQTSFSADAVFNPPYPRIAGRPHGTLLNYTSSSVFDADARHIAKHHVVIVPGVRNNTWQSPDGIQNIGTLPAYIKRYNPNVKLIKYTNSNQQATDSTAPANTAFINDKLRSESGGGRGDWWKRTAANATITGFSSTAWQINNTLKTSPDAAGLRWPQWFPRYWHVSGTATTAVGDWVAPDPRHRGAGLSDGEWDGTFSDSQYISEGPFAATADYDGNGTNESPADATTKKWVVEGQRALVDAWESLNPSYFQLGQFGNFTAPNEVDDYMLVQGIYDGGLIQDISKRDGQGSGWSLMMGSYRRGLEIAKGPKIVIFHNKIKELLDDNPGITSVYRWNRYGLTSALMDNGYYAVFTPGDVRPEYDEFFGGDNHSVSNLGYLGYPVDPPQTSAWSQGVYRREFNNGLVLVNPKGNGTKTVNIGTGWKRISGRQDPIHNNGQVVTSITLAEQDGIILLRENRTAPPNPPELMPPG